jgi:RNA-directed DNA polymerase
MQGHCFLIRFAADFIIGCARAANARRIMAGLPKRLARFRRTIHPEKTALIACKMPPSRHQSAGGTGTFCKMSMGKPIPIKSSNSSG